MMNFVQLVCAVLVSSVVAEINIIDLTHTFGYDTVYWPPNPPFNFSLAFETPLRDSYKAVSNYFQTAEHSGTHMDAPQHFCPGAEFVHELPMERLSGPGVAMDFRSQAAADYDYQVSLQDVKDWEAKNGLVPKGAIVFLNFGWNQYWPDWEKVFNTQNFSDTSSFHFPGLGIDASRYLAGTRKIHAVGHDTPSTDYGQNVGFAVHINLLCENAVIILENVGNIDALPTVGTHVYIGAIKLQNGSGTPVRLFAVHDDNGGDPSSARETTLNSICVSLVLALIMALIVDSLRG